MSWRAGRRYIGTARKRFPQLDRSDGKFFAELGIRNSREMKKAALALAMQSYTSVGFYLSLTIEELNEYADLITEMLHKK